MHQSICDQTDVTHRGRLHEFCLPTHGCLALHQYRLISYQKVILLSCHLLSNISAWLSHTVRAADDVAAERAHPTLASWLPYRPYMA